MKKLIFLLALALFALNVSAKKVKFSVDLTGFEISPNGVHVTGDFQTIAGFPGGDWSSESTPMAREAETDIFSIIVDIPAFQKYEYRFVNGDQFYETEFVPLESRVGYEFNDNRWIYVDSIANDTTFTGAIVFGENAPQGQFLVRFKVNLENLASISEHGVHVAGSFQGWNTATTRLYSFEENIYEIISFMPEGDYQFKFLNGNTDAGYEIVPAECSGEGNRQIFVNDHVVLNTVCFSSCVDCIPSSLFDEMEAASVRIRYDAANTMLLISSAKEGIYQMAIFDMQGKLLSTNQLSLYPEASSDISRLADGIYIIRLSNGSTMFTSKFLKK